MSNFSKNSEVILLNKDLVWKRLNLYQSADMTQKLLNRCYKNIQIDNHEIKSYDNCYPFIYFLQHGEMYYSQAEHAPIPIKPVLLFYGLIHLIKACLLSVDPDYPESTSVLAHGVSSRKKKKQHYQFMNDEIKIQKMGLCTHFSKKMFHVEHLEGEKIIMKDLFYQIPELDDCFTFNNKCNIIHILKNNIEYAIPLSILDQYHLTLDSFTRLLEDKNAISIQTINYNKDYIIIKSTNEDTPLLPFRFHLTKNSFCLPNKQAKYMYYPELIIHYLLLYNLSMIARYETEWWCELIKTTPTNDYPFISTFLSITAEKTPYLILKYLQSKL